MRQLIERYLCRRIPMTRHARRNHARLVAAADHAARQHQLARARLADFVASCACQANVPDGWVFDKEALVFRPKADRPPRGNHPALGPPAPRRAEGDHNSMASHDD